MTPPSTPASAPTPIATIDSPSATIMMRPWRSAKWPATSRQPLVSMKSGPAMSNTSAIAHTVRRTSPSNCEPTTRIATPIAVLSDSPTTAWRSPGSSRLASMNSAMCGGAYRAVGHGQREAQIAECLWDAQRGHEQRRHRGEQDEADAALLGVDHAGQPRVPDPRPPQQAQHDETLADATPCRIVRHQRRALRDGEDEDEVEEQLERTDPLALAQDHPDAREVSARNGHAQKFGAAVALANA